MLRPVSRTFLRMAARMVMWGRSNWASVKKEIAMGRVGFGEGGRVRCCRRRECREATWWRRVQSSAISTRELALAWTFCRVGVPGTVRTFLAMSARGRASCGSD